MCEPMTIAAVAAGASAVGAGAQYMGQRQAANDMNAAFKENQRSQLAAYADDLEAINLNAMAADEDATQRRLQVSRDAQSARGSAVAAAAERGIGGFTLAAIERNFGFQEGEAIASINRNQELDGQRTRLSQRSAQNSRTAAIRSAPRSRGPSLLGLGASLASAAAGGFSDYKMMKAAENAQT